MAPGFPLQKERKIKSEETEAWLSEADGGWVGVGIVSLLLSSTHIYGVPVVSWALQEALCRACVLGGRDGH